MDWNLDTYTFIKSTQRGSKEEEVCLAVTDMLEELFQTASDAVINCKFEQHFLSNEAPCGKTEQILASVRELIDELFIKASRNYDWDLAPQCSSEEHKSRDVNKKCSPTPMTAFIENNGEGQLADTKRSEISKECQTATSAAETPRDISDIEDIIPEHPLYESEISDGQIPDQNLIIINEKSCSDLQESESQHNTKCDISKIREDMQKDYFVYLQDSVDSEKISQAATDQEEAQNTIVMKFCREATSLLYTCHFYLSEMKN